MSVGSSVATILAQARVIANIEYLPLFPRLANAAVSYVTYLWQTVWPSKLAVYYPHLGMQLPAWRALVACAIVIAISVAVFLRRRKQPYLLVGWFWFVGTLVPVIGIVQVGTQAHADRYTYLPAIGIYLMVAWGAAAWARQWRRGRVFLGAAGSIIIIGLVVVAIKQTLFWRTPEIFWNHTLAVTRHNEVAHNGVGFIYLTQGRTEDAIAHFYQALKIRPDYIDAAANLGLAFSRTGRAGEAIAVLREVVKSRPRDARSRSFLANALMLDGRKEEAIEQFRSVLEMEPGNAEARFKLGEALAQTGRLEEGITQLRTATELRPRQVEVHVALGNALVDLGRIDEGITSFQRALEVQPDFADAQYNLGISLFLKKRFPEAIAAWWRAYEIQPELANLRANLAWLLATFPEAGVRDGARAFALAKELEARTPDDPLVYRSLGAAYAETGRFDDAITVAKKAMELARTRGDTVLPGVLEQDMISYRAGKPLRDLSQTGSETTP